MAGGQTGHFGPVVRRHAGTVNLQDKDLVRTLRQHTTGQIVPDRKRN